MSPGLVVPFDAAQVAAADDWWHDCARRALEWWAASGVEFDAYSVTELGVPDPDDSHRWGALFRAAATEGLIVPVGWRQARRPSRASGACRVWVGREHEAARAA